MVTGIITPQGEIQSTLDKSGEHNSHYGLKYHYGTKWRYNPKTKIVYWPSTNWSEQSNDDKISVENHLHKRYGFEVKDHMDMNFKGGHKYINVAHGIMKESVTTETIKKSQLKTLIKEIIKEFKNVTVPYGGWLDPNIKLHEVEYKINKYDDVDWEAWWLDPTGKFHDIYSSEESKSGHWNWAKKYLISQNKSFDRLDSPSEILFEAGWVRVAFNYYKDGVLHFDARKDKLTNCIMRSLKIKAIEHQASALIDDNTHKSIELNEGTSASITKERLVKSFLSQMNDNTIVVTVSREDEIPETSYVQVDGFVNGQNVFSSNPEDLTKWGFKIPSSQQFLTLQRGRYKLGDAKAKLKMSLKEVRQFFTN